MNIRKEYIQVNCKADHCEHYNTCCETSTVIIYSKNNKDVDLMFIGQGAGSSEDINITPENINREPFYGRSGSYLRHLLLYMWNNGTKFNIALSNTVRCHPIDKYGKDRCPTELEKDICITHLNMDITQLSPKAIITLGKDTTNFMLSFGKDKPIGQVRGKLFTYMGIPTVPTYHPSYLCRLYGKFTSNQQGNAHILTLNDINKALNEAQNNLTLL